MSKVKFRAGARAIKSDMDRIGDLAEADITRLVKALIADTGGDSIFNTILGSNITLNDLGPTIEVSTTTDAFFAANSFFGNVAAGTVGTYTDTGGAAPSATLYAVVERFRDRGSRVFADTSVPPVLATDPSAEIAIIEEYRLDVFDDPTVPTFTKAVPDQVSIDYVRIATLNGDGSGFTFDPDGIIWAFPGLASAIVAHAVSHTTGGDQIPSATAAARGLMAINEFLKARGAIQTITPTGALTAATAGDNNPTDKTATLGLALRTSSPSGLTQAGGALGVDFTAVAPAGHTHSALIQNSLAVDVSTAVSGLYTITFTGLAGVAEVGHSVYLLRSGTYYRLPDLQTRTVGGSTIELGVEVWWDSAAGALNVHCPSGILARVTGTAAAALGLSPTAQAIHIGGSVGSIVAVITRPGTV